jgi:hypothetical protein
MKLLMIGFVALFSLGAFANSKDWDKMPFDQQKQMKLQKLDKKSAMIQESRSCVNAAKDKADLKECSEEMKEKQSMMEREHEHKTKQSQESHKKDSSTY